MMKDQALWLTGHIQRACRLSYGCGLGPGYSFQQQKQALNYEEPAFVAP